MYFSFFHRDACEFIVHFKMVKEEELNAIALFSQKNAALDDFAESCKSLLEQVSFLSLVIPPFFL